MNRFPLSRVLSVVLSASLLVTCPGAYAAAQTIGRAASASPTIGVNAVPRIGADATGSAILSLSPAALTLTSGLSAPSAPALAIVAPAAAALTASAPVLTAAKRSPVTAAVPAAVLKPAALTKTIAAAAKNAAAILDKVGPVTDASPAAVGTAGHRLEEILTGAPALSARAADLSAPASGAWGEFNETRHLARPAGDSIRESAAASSDGTVPPAPPDGRGPAPRGDGPFWPRLFSAALALAPAVFLGFPLLAAQAYLVGGLVLATSAALAIMPFLGESSPKILRSAPGLGLAALGVSALGVTLSLTFGLGVVVAPALGWAGAFALLGGWGLSRYGLGKSEKRWGSYGSVETLSAFFGGLAGVTAVALAALTPAGWIATGGLWLSTALTALLWFHLPGWVGHGLGAALVGVWHSIHGLSRVLTAIHRDTVLRDRLEKFSKRWFDSSKWNAVWLALIWAPLLIVEAAMYAISAVAGLAIGVVTAPVNALWGATQKLWPKSALHVYFAEASRLVFDNVANGKVKVYNPLVKSLVAMANSPKLGARAIGALGLRVAQLGWLVYSLIAAPVLSVVGLLTALRGGAYDEKRHDVEDLRVNRQDKFEKPGDDGTEPGPQPEPGKSPLAPKLIAMALALVPMYFFGLPILAGGSFIQIPLYLALIVPLAAMPFLSKAPQWAKSFAGRAMFYNGLVLLLNGSAILVGLIALLGGWGFSRWVKKTAEKDGRFDEAELGAYFGALGSAAAIGAVWTGFVGGWIGWGTLGLAAVTSLFLIMHLPAWLFEGVRKSLKQFGKSAEAYLEVLTAWKNGTDFYGNLKKHANYWLEKTYWNGVWLSVIWVPAGIALAAQSVLSLALGLVTGLIRSPVGFAAGAFQEAKPNTRKAIFFAEWAKSWLAATEGSKDFFEMLTLKTKLLMSEKSPVSGRPTARAWFGLLGQQLITAVWLIGVLLLNFSGAALLWGVYKGLRAAWAPKKSEA